MATEQKESHGSHPHHHHDAAEEMSFSEKNRTHWDKHAANYMSDHIQKEFGDLINKITAFILANVTWISGDFLDPATSFEKASNEDKTNQSTKKVRVLDYACGPGTITIALANHANEFIGIDLSQKMVDEYNKRFNEVDSTTEQPNPYSSISAKAITGNLFAPEGPTPSEILSSPKYSNFDLAAVGMGFHHFEHLDLVTARLVERLRPGGTLMIVDFLPHAKNDLYQDHDNLHGHDHGHDHGHGHGHGHGDSKDETKVPADIIAHHGFTEESVRELFGAVGLVDVDLRVMPETVMLRGKAARNVFIARGTKKGYL